MAVMENPPEPLRLTRSELYARAWTKPTIRLAEEFGITNFLLSGICKKHQIPTPPAGYWSKVAHGKALSRPPLPGDGDILIDIGQARTPGFRASKPRPPIQRADRVAPVVPPPTPAQALVEPHAKVLKTVARLRAGKGGGLVRVCQAGCFKVTASVAIADRVAVVLDRLLVKVEEQGWRVKACDRINEVLMQNAKSPWRDAPNAVIAESFWSDRDVQRLAYHRGEIFAFLIDHTIRAETDGAQDLDDVISAMQQTADEGPAPMRLSSMVEDVTGVDVSNLVARHIADGEPVFLAADTFGACGTVVTIEQPVFVAGMTARLSSEGRTIIATVDENGPAWEAGFREGMTILERVSGRAGDGSLDSVFRVETASGEVEEIGYRPTNGETYLLQQLVVSNDAATSAACRARLAGVEVGSEL